ncbi:MAG: hypothetical protein DWQ07_14050 [Chloroflexi bacterium]|nr:MAG: hypothetical protein DWQ07_14050 [Chloroflexota bacterium]
MDVVVTEGDRLQNRLVRAYERLPGRILDPVISLTLHLMSAGMLAWRAEDIAKGMQAMEPGMVADKATLLVLGQVRKRLADLMRVLVLAEAALIELTGWQVDLLREATEKVETAADVYE